MGGAAAVGGLDVVRQAARVRWLAGLTGQHRSVDEALTGYENLVLVGQLLDLRRSDAKARVVELLGRHRSELPAVTAFTPDDCHVLQETAGADAWAPVALVRRR